MPSSIIESLRHAWRSGWSLQSEEAREARLAWQCYLAGLGLESPPCHRAIARRPSAETLAAETLAEMCR
jgi:hypothetical protein